MIKAVYTNNFNTTGTILINATRHLEGKDGNIISESERIDHRNIDVLRAADRDCGYLVEVRETYAAAE